MGLSDQDIADITVGWLETMTAAQNYIVQQGGYTWSLIPGQSNANAMPQLLSKDTCALQMIANGCSDGDSGALSVDPSAGE